MDSIHSNPVSFTHKGNVTKIVPTTLYNIQNSVHVQYSPIKRGGGGGVWGSKHSHATGKIM